MINSNMILDLPLDTIQQKISIQSNTQKFRPVMKQTYSAITDEIQVSSPKFPGGSKRSQQNDQKIFTDCYNLWNLCLLKQISEITLYSAEKSILSIPSDCENKIIIESPKKSKYKKKFERSTTKKQSIDYLSPNRQSIPLSEFYLLSNSFNVLVQSNVITPKQSANLGQQILSKHTNNPQCFKGNNEHHLGGQKNFPFSCIKIDNYFLEQLIAFTLINNITEWSVSNITQRNGSLTPNENKIDNFRPQQFTTGQAMYLMSIGNKYKEKICQNFIKK